LSAGVAATIKEKINIVDFIGEQVPLKKAGASYKGLCPFHGEKTPSFVVTPGRETWKCFGCGLGGDVFSFVMQREGVDFPEALRRLAGRAGVELDERTSREDAQRKRLREVLEGAIAFYHAALTNHRVGERALAYLHERGFTDATVEAYQLGYAPDSWDALTKALRTKRNATDAEMEGAGLVIKGRRDGVYDRFRGRVMFPIRDASGGASGLGGRILDGPTAITGEGGADNAEAGAGADARQAAGADAAARDRGPKYLNSPATLLFDKSRTLYLIDRAKGPMRKAQQAVIVEGYTDALMAHQHGFDNVVGGLGTALTAGQVELATRYAPAIALAYDVDPAGQGAGTFGATELTALIGEIERSAHKGRLTDVSVVRLPEGQDPDQVIRADPDTWRAAAAAPQPIMEYLIDTFTARYDPKTIQGRERLVAAVMPTLRAVSDPVRRDGYLQLLARRSGVEERVLLEKLRQPSGVGAGRGRSAGGAGFEGAHAGGRINLDAVLSSPGALDPQAVARTLEPVESALLRLLLVHPSWQLRLRDRLPTDGLVTTPARELWRAMLADRDGDAGGEFRRDRYLAALDETLAALARTLYARDDPEPETEEALEQAVEQCLLSLDRRRLSELFDFKRAEMAEAETAPDAPAVERIRAEILTLQRERAELDRRLDAGSLLSRSAGRRAAAAGTTP
jgi:DNA primase